MSEVLDKNHIKTFLHKRKPDSHKGTYGHALLVAGSKGYMGAAVICTKACLRAGAGLTTVNVPDEEALLIHCSAPEAMVQSRMATKIDLSGYTAIGIGPGLGLLSSSKKLVQQIISSGKQSLVIDADALNILSKNKSWLSLLPKQCILTPHAKEFDRLFGNHQNMPARVNTAKQAAKKYNLIVVLKNHPTSIISSNAVFENTTGNAGLAKGGSGDALTGIITAFLAQGYAPFDAAKAGVFIHGLAADLALQKQSKESLLATDTIEALGLAFKKIWK